MAVITPSAKTQFIGANGEPLVGGKLYTYAAGTTTPSPTYTDNTGATPNTNPVILDSRGEANVWLGEATYKFKLCDANDVEIWTVDYISAPTTALSPVLTGNVTISSDSSGPALKITQTGTGYVMRVQDSADPDSTPFVINSSGYVGLGTAAPAEALDIDNNGKLQFSDSGTARTVISADATNSTIDVKDNRNLVIKTNATTIWTGNSTDITTTVPVVLPGVPTTSLQASTKGYVDTIASGKVDTTVSIIAGTGLSGGGALTTSRTLSVAAGGISATELASDAVTTVKILNSNVTPAKLSQPFTTATALSANTFLNRDFTSIPSWVRRIDILFDSVSQTTANQIIIQIGPSGTPETSGYASTITSLTNGLAVTATTLTNGFGIYIANATYAVSGIVTLANISGNIWVASGCQQSSQGVGLTMSGTKTLAGTLDIVRVTNSGGTGTFDSGTINIMYQ